MANNTSSNDKYFFRNEGLTEATNVPRDVTWAISEGPGAMPSGGSEGDSSYVGEIVFNEKTGEEEWQPAVGMAPGTPGLVQCPTPIITEVVTQRVSQNEEGIARTSVVLAVNCIDDVEYEVVVTPA